MSYTKLDTNSVKSACEIVIQDIEDYWNDEKEKWIKQKMTEKKVVNVVWNWFKCKKEYEFYTREEAEQMLHELPSEYSFFTPYAMIYARYSSQYYNVKKLLKLARASNEDYMFISAEDFADIAKFYPAYTGD